MLDKKKLRWIFLIMAFFATVINYVDRIAFNYLSADGPLRSLISDKTFGYIGMIFFIGYMISNLISGFVIDKLGTRLGYSACMAFWTSATLLQSVARIPLHFGIIRFLLGIGEAGNWPAAIKLTGEWFSPEERSTAIGIFNSGATVGSIITPPLMIWLSKTYNWQTIFIIIAAAGYLWLLVFWFIYYTPDEFKQSIPKKAFNIKPLLKSRFIVWFTLSKAFMDPIWYFLTFWIARYLVDVYKWDLSKKGWLIVLPFLTADIGNITGGYFTQLLIRKGVSIPKARKISVGIFGSMVVLALATAPFTIHSPAEALFILAFATYGHAAYTCNTMSFPGDVVPASNIASVWGLASVGAGLGGMLFQWLSGTVIDKLATTYNYTTAYNSVFVGYGICALIALIIIIFFIGPLNKDKRLFTMAGVVATK